ncbi:hypothetical protein PLICRDRAFT_124276 [Plicaturopsis crispa FD-325 SS-3]|nr:hypothetical protein PLICRDRAFT_124276 [Plicaturopsis crispa FD-325 SS-3]
MSDIPTTQKAWLVLRRGTPAQSVELKDVEVPSKLGAGEVLVRVQAAAFNPVGYKLMAMLPNFIANRPLVAEHDLAGVVVDGNGTRFKNGDPVFGWIPVALQLKTRQGALQQYARLPASHLAARPPNVSVTGASGFTLAAQTAYQGLFKTGGLQDGQRVFVNGGSSSVGAFAIQIAKAHGCHVTASASAKNEEFVRSLGADDFVDYTTGPLHTTLVANAPAQKYHIFFDAVGSSSPALYTHSPAYVAPGGVYVTTGPQPSFSFSNIADIVSSLVNALLRPTWLGGTKTAWKFIGVDHKEEDLEALRKLAADRKLKPVTDSVYSFEDVQKAYERIQTHRARGKVVVKVDAKVD